MPRTRPKPSRPDAQALAQWAPWARGFRDDLPPIVDGFFEPGVTVSDDGSTVRLYDEIGFWGCTATEFAEALDSANDEVTLRINSPGGDVFDGLAIYNTIRSHRGPVHAVVDGIAASAASFIAVGAADVTMSRGSQLMIHDALGLCIGNAADARRLADLLDLQSDNIAGLYAAKAGGTAEQWRDAMRDERWYLADAAVEAGLADATDDDDADEAPTDRLRMAWHEWIRAYAGREQNPPQPAPPAREPERPAASAFPWDPDRIIRAVEQGR